MIIDTLNKYILITRNKLYVTFLMFTRFKGYSDQTLIYATNT